MDWYVLEFYQHVADSYRNQAAGADYAPTPAFVEWESLARVHGYPEHEWPWLFRHARAVFRWHRAEEPVEWYKETGKTLDQLTPEDICGAD